MTQPHDHNFKWIKNTVIESGNRDGRTRRLFGRLRCDCGAEALGDCNPDGEALLGKARVLVNGQPHTSLIVKLQETVRV